MCPERRDEPDLTAEQRELLRAAVRRGYFEVPRRVSLADLAEEQGVSDREASERLRRGVEAMVSDAVLDA
jgi:predicted DNA binding protein